MTLEGCGTALITPFRPDGSLDEPALRAHVQWQVQQGISLLVPCGTTGEAAALTEQEWLRVVEITVEAAAGRVPVFAGATHNATAQTVSNVRKLAQIPGLTGALVANPYYNKPSQEGQYQHFRAVAEASELVIMLYNIPGRTAANLLPETAARLAECANIVAIKESSGNLAQITELITLLPRRISVLAGDDALALPTIAVGGCGLVSVASNAMPHAMVRMINAALNDKWSSARILNRELFPFLQANFIEPSPAPIKAALALLERGNETLRLPMVPVSRETRRRLEALLAEFGVLPESANL